MPLSFSSVLFDEQEQVFKMWYSLHTRGQGDAASLLCYATSKDGVTWQKPELGIYEFRGTKQNNIVSTDKIGSKYKSGRHTQRRQGTRQQTVTS